MTPYYEKNGIMIYHGDCREIVPQLRSQSIDLLCTDPPYGIGEARGKNKSREQLALPKDYGVAAWDDEPPPSWLFDQLRELTRWQIIFGGNFFALPAASCWLVWDKDNSGDFADCELAWTNLKKAVRRLRWRWNGMLQENGGIHKEPRLHPTQKPLAVMRWAIGHAPDAALILDPFMGSGSTLVAAKLEGRKAIGIELEEKYCEAAAKRLAQGVLPFASST